MLGYSSHPAEPAQPESHPLEATKLEEVWGQTVFASHGRISAEDGGNLPSISRILDHRIPTEGEDLIPGDTAGTSLGPLPTMAGSTLITPPLSTAFSLPRDDVGLLVDASFEVMGEDEVLHPGGINLEVQNKHEGQEGARWSAGLACKCTARRNNFSAFSWFAVTSSRSSEVCIY